MNDRERIDRIKAGDPIEVQGQAEALRLCKAAKREIPATTRKIEDGTWEVRQVPRGGFGSVGGLG